MGKESWHENFWANDKDNKKIVGVTITFKNKKDRDNFLQNSEVVFQQERGY